MIRIYSHPEDEDLSEGSPVQRRHTLGYVIPAWVLIGVNVFLGLFPAIACGLIGSGFGMLM